jgi:hypothetical protein
MQYPDAVLRFDPLPGRVPEWESDTLTQPLNVLRQISISEYECRQPTQFVSFPLLSFGARSPQLLAERGTEPAVTDSQAVKPSLSNIRIFEIEELAEWPASGNIDDSNLPSRRWQALNILSDYVVVMSLNEPDDGEDLEDRVERIIDEDRELFDALD